MREGGGRIHFKERWLVFRNRFFQRLLHTFLLSFFERVHVYTRFPARGVFIFYVGSHVTFGKIPSSMDRDHETWYCFNHWPHSFKGMERDFPFFFLPSSFSCSRPMIVLIVFLFYIFLYFHFRVISIVFFFFFFRTRILIFSRVERKNTGFIHIEMILFIYPSQINRKNWIGKVLFFWRILCIFKSRLFTKLLK